MIFVITGRPRNGKTLFTIGYIKKKAENENRQVYYTRIKGINFPNWHQLDDAKKWQDCPDGSIILFDEAHYDFPNRTSTSNTPPHVLGFNVHGHNGLDLYFITQDGQKFLDPNIRGLAQEHLHVVRHWGKEKATIHKWDSFKSNPDHKTNKADSVKTKYTYNKALYGQYVSSTDHNVKQNVPLKYKLLWIIPIVILGLLGKVGYSWFFDKKPQQPQAELTKDAINEPSIFQPQQQLQQPYEKKLSYLEARTPEHPDIQESAPIYQANHTPKHIPRPQACIASKTQCKCYTQQATAYPASHEFCMQVVQNGYFIDDLEQPQPQLQPLQNDTIAQNDIRPLQPL